MTGVRAIVVVNDPFEATLLTSEEAAILTRAASRGISGPTKSTIDPLELPRNEFQCVHTDVSYVQRTDAPKGVTAPIYESCLNSIEDGEGYLCGYHTKSLLTPRLTTSQLAEVNKLAQDSHAETVAVGVILTDLREMANYPIKKVNGLKVHQSPFVPQLKRIVIDPAWEKVDLNGR